MNVNVDRVVEASFASFERFLRWIYPGLLFWLTLPLALRPAGEYALFFHNTPWEVQAALAVVSGFLIYMVERYLIHEALLLHAMFYCGTGAAVNFRDDQHKCYPAANGRLMWIRFGARPSDSTRLGEHGEEGFGERAENRFDNYMASRMASVHALSCTWIVGGVVLLIGQTSKCSALNGWEWWHYVYVAGLLFVFLAWVWQAWVAARAEQEHYKK